MYASHGGGNSVRGCPRRLEEIEADLARLEVDVRVANGCVEFDGGWAEGVLCRDFDVEEPAAACLFEEVS